MAIAILKELSFVIKDESVKDFFFFMLAKLHGEEVDVDNLFLIDELRNVTNFMREALDVNSEGIDILADPDAFDLITSIEAAAEGYILEAYDIDVSKLNVKEMQFLELDTLRIIY